MQPKIYEFILNSRSHGRHVFQALGQAPRQGRPRVEGPLPEESDLWREEQQQPSLRGRRLWGKTVLTCPGLIRRYRRGLEEVQWPPVEAVPSQVTPTWRPWGALLPRPHREGQHRLRRPLHPQNEGCWLRNIALQRQQPRYVKCFLQKYFGSKWGFWTV